MTKHTASTMELHIVSAHGDVFTGTVSMVSAMAVNGDLGILPNHSPLLARLKPGMVRIRDSLGEQDYIYVSGGIVEVQPHLVTILADTALRGDEIDEQAARAARAEAQNAMASSVLYSDRDAAKLELMKALAQLQTLQEFRHKSHGNTGHSRHLAGEDEPL